MIDVTTEIVIERPRAQVAAYAADPSNATEWYEQIERVEWQTAPPLAVGSRVAFVARFLGRRLAYTYEVVELEAASPLANEDGRRTLQDGNDVQMGRRR